MLHVVVFWENSERFQFVIGLATNLLLFSKNEFWLGESCGELGIDSDSSDCWLFWKVSIGKRPVCEVYCRLAEQYVIATSLDSLGLYRYDWFLFNSVMWVLLVTRFNKFSMIMNHHHPLFPSFVQVLALMNFNIKLSSSNINGKNIHCTCWMCPAFGFDSFVACVTGEFWTGWGIMDVVLTSPWIYPHCDIISCSEIRRSSSCCWIICRCNSACFIKSCSCTPHWEVGGTRRWPIMGRVGLNY